MRFRATFVTILCALASACAPVSLLNALVPADGYRVEKNIAYGKQPRQQLDLYVPDGVTKDTPVIVFFYGGSWQFGSKETYKFAAQGLVSLGYIVAVPDYRLYPEITYPEFLNDSAQAVAWVYNHIGDYGASGENFYLIGHSAGAYNAMMLALEPKYLERAGGKVAWLRGVVGMAGPYDFLPLTDPKLQAVFSSEPMLEKTQPVYYARAHLPRVLLLTGSDDDTVRPKNSQHLYEKLKALGNRIELKEYEGVGHKGIIRGLSTLISPDERIKEDVRQFIQER